VRERKVSRPAIRLARKALPEALQAQSEETWDKVLKAQSTKESESLDVSDEIAADMQAIECLGRAGYRPLAAVAYLRKLAFNKEQPWADWLARQSIGLEYRIERVLALAQEGLAQGKFPDGSDSQAKRFASAAKQWNLLP
jgi:hypothetical protein